MSPNSTSNLLSTWLTEANKRMSDIEKAHGQLRVDFTRLEATIRTRNKVAWAAVGFGLTVLIVLIPVIVKLVKLMQELKTVGL